MRGGHGRKHVCLILSINGESLDSGGEIFERAWEKNGKEKLGDTLPSSLFIRTQRAGRDRKSRAIEAEQTFQLWALTPS